MIFKVLYIYFIIVISLFAGETALIASFNALHLGWRGSNYYKKAEVIAHFDLIALQEVMSKEGIRRLTRELERITGENWRWHISNRSLGRSNNYREYYGFVYRSDKVNFVKSHGTYNDMDDRFIREPYGAEFSIGNFDFILVNCHLIFGDRRADRQLEAMELHNVYDYFMGLNDQDDIIILGDFNLPAYDDAFANLFSHPDLIFYAIDPSNLTTIGNTSFSNSYDNIFYSYVHTKEYTGRYGVYDFVNQQKYIDLYGEDRFRILRREISDHLPVYIEVNISGEY